MSAKIYVEGGGDRREQQSKLRSAFSVLFEKCGFARPNAPTVVCSGSRNRAYRDFVIAMRRLGNECLLLVDSEGPVSKSPWEHLSARDGWERPVGSREDQAQLMIEVMENWFLSDREMLADFFGSGFSSKQLPGRAEDIESISKLDVERGLAKATSPSKKGEYHKGNHSHHLLSSVCGTKLSGASKAFSSLTQALEARRK